jgi:hypothetical protein
VNVITTPWIIDTRIVVRLSNGKRAAQNIARAAVFLASVMQRSTRTMYLLGQSSTRIRRRIDVES